MDEVEDRVEQGAVATPGETRAAGSAGPTAAARLAPLVEHFFAGPPPVPFAFWDGSRLGPGTPPTGGRGTATTATATTTGTVRFRSKDALRTVLWAPNEIGLVRAYVSGQVEVDGDLFGVLRALEDGAGPKRRPSAGALAGALVSAVRLGTFGRRPRPPDEEVHLRGWRHSKGRDAAAICHHYDVGDDFYRLVLGPSMAYSCARFKPGETSLENAQRAKHDLICRKLGLHQKREGHLLDVGCGWGAMAIHAAQAYGAKVVAITLSPSQARAARERAAAAGVGDKVTVRLQDYRDLGGETFDAISSIGMFEHVGSKRMSEYFSKLFSLLAPCGRLLNHAISKRGSSKMKGATFINRYVFPDGELIDVAKVVHGMERAGFEVRDAESLREHYVKTLTAWVTNLDRSWDRAVELAGEARARTWRLYMSASANSFADGGLAVHQVLGVRPAAGGASGMPPTRAGWD
ncbi:MAG: class I SAM-dependent methyltransferase [Acidimicrobiales bacterium]